MQQPLPNHDIMHAPYTITSNPYDITKPRAVKTICCTICSRYSQDGLM